MRPVLAAALLFSASTPASAQEVHADRTVTFHYTAPNAHEVSVSGDWGKGGPLTKDEAGLWSLTVGPLEPNLYSYNFTVDGKQALDPFNNRFKPERVGAANVVDVPGDKPAVWDRQPGVPHGVVHLHDYDAKALGSVRHLRIYTPPGYDKAADTRYPTLYLLHGSGDNEATWSEFGRAQVILDNLIAAGKAKPMLVVMPDGHTGPPMPRNSPKAAEARTKYLSEFETDLLSEIIPLTDSLYRTRPDRESRAIIGLSMGGNQSLIVSLNHLDLFAWVGGMSSALREPETQIAPFLKDTASANGKLRLLWIACGQDDRLLPDNQRLDALLTEKQVKHSFVQTPGAHAWPVWRRNLAEFAPKLFE